MLNEVYQLYNKTLTKEASVLWIGSMRSKGISGEDALSGLQAYITDPDKGQYIPKPSDIIGKVLGDGSDVETLAQVGFGIMLEAVRKIGAYRVPQFDDPNIARAISSMGGWIQMCMMETDQIPTIRAQFVRAYTATYKSAADLPPLKGIFSGQNEVQTNRLPTGINVKALLNNIQKGR
jgi:hypothetical protein